MDRVIINSLEDLEKLEGQEIGCSDYLTITQEQIQKFADATLDQQWIHIDPERAAVESPFKTTIAHGYLTMSLAPYLLGQIIEAHNVKMVVNYGIEKLRFSEPVRVNSRVRARAEMLKVKNLRGLIRCNLKVTFEIEDYTKPAAVAEIVFLYQF